jgi:hypothetical protein
VGDAHHDEAAMNCPRCETAKLEERERDGVQIDVCTGCRGIWLDRGELEKLVARGGQVDDEDEVTDERPGGAPRRKVGFFDSIGDLFD